MCERTYGLLLSPQRLVSETALSAESAIVVCAALLLALGGCCPMRMDARGGPISLAKVRREVILEHESNGGATVDMRRIKGAERLSKEMIST